jgi:hypothetical protein
MQYLEIIFSMNKMIEDINYIKVAEKSAYYKINFEKR